LKRKRKRCAEVAKGLGIWSITVGIRKKERRGQQFPKISLKY